MPEVVDFHPGHIMVINFKPMGKKRRFKFNLYQVPKWVFIHFFMCVVHWLITLRISNLSLMAASNFRQIKSKSLAFGVISIL